jgi:two-component system sensor histidine kinase DegS
MRSGERPARTAEDRQTEMRGPAVAGPQSALIELMERERKRLGFDLHDGPAQYMSAALLQIRMLERGPDDLASALAELRATVGRALAQTYDLIGELTGPRDDDGDFLSQISAMAAEVRAGGDVQVELDLAGDPGSLSESQRIAVYRIVQEALTNVRRHARASHVSVTVRFDPDATTCIVSDDGCGFDPSLHRNRGGRAPFGVHGMRERARLLDGELTLRSEPGQGTCVMARIPAWQR